MSGSPSNFCIVWEVEPGNEASFIALQSLCHWTGIFLQTVRNYFNCWHSLYLQVPTYSINVSILHITKNQSHVHGNLIGISPHLHMSWKCERIQLRSGRLLIHCVIRYIHEVLYRYTHTILKRKWTVQHYVQSCITL